LDAIDTRGCMARLATSSLAGWTMGESALLLHDLQCDFIQKRREKHLPGLHLRLVEAWDALPNRLLFFLRLGRRLLWLLRCWRWTLFKDNLSFPGNVRAYNLLSKLLQIEFDIRDSLFQGFVFVWHMFVFL
jgi:hypothetical protein